MNIPNCYLYCAVTQTGGLLQTLVPFGEEPTPYLDKATDDGDVLESPWKCACVVYAQTIRNLIESVS